MKYLSGVLGGHDRNFAYSGRRLTLQLKEIATVQSAVQFSFLAAVNETFETCGARCAAAIALNGRRFIATASVSPNPKPKYRGLKPMR